MNLHECEGNLPEEGYGPAIEGCSEKDDGTIWTGNSEYGSQVRFCPYCGFEAKTAPEVVSDKELERRRDAGEDLFKRIAS